MGAVIVREQNQPAERHEQGRTPSAKGQQSGRSHAQTLNEEQKETRHPPKRRMEYVGPQPGEALSQAPSARGVKGAAATRIGAYLTKLPDEAWGETLKGHTHEFTHWTVTRRFVRSRKQKEIQRAPPNGRQTGPLAVCEPIGRRKKDIACSFDLKGGKSVNGLSRKS